MACEGATIGHFLICFSTWTRSSVPFWTWFLHDLGCHLEAQTMKNRPKSRKSEVRGVPEALGRGPGAILAPKGAPGTENMQTGHSSTPPSRTHLESQICTFPIFWVFISHLFLDWRLGRLPGRFFMASGRFFHGFADRFFPCFGSAPTGGKCRLDTLLIRFEAQRRCGPEAINMIKSYTFLGCFPEGLLEWILGRF